MSVELNRRSQSIKANQGIRRSQELTSYTTDLLRKNSVQNVLNQARRTIELPPTAVVTIEGQVNELYQSNIDAYNKAVDDYENQFSRYHT